MIAVLRLRFWGKGDGEVARDFNGYWRASQSFRVCRCPIWRYTQWMGLEGSADGRYVLLMRSVQASTSDSFSAMLKA